MKSKRFLLAGTMAGALLVVNSCNTAEESQKSAKSETPGNGELMALDTDGDQKVSTAEMAVYIEARGLPEGPKLAKRVDLDGNGEISSEEFNKRRESINGGGSSAGTPGQRKFPEAHKLGKFFDSDGTRMAYGGKKDSEHFDISNLELKEEQFHYGMGREVFPALLEPEYITMKEADEVWKKDDRFLVVQSGDEAKAYSIKDLTRHEVVNDEINGTPIFAAYCILADLGAIYERQYGDEELTFAVSGYTYFDPEVWNGLDGFVLWDRETESLWWPLINKAVSGPLKDVQFQKMDEANWEDLTWGELRKKYKNVQVLKSGQDFERPENWDSLDNPDQIKENFSIAE